MKECAIARPLPYPVSDHCDGQRFFNPGVSTDRGLRDLLRWRLAAGQSVAWPPQAANTPYPAPDAADTLAADAVSVTFIGQATFLLTTRHGTLLTDPFFSPRASPLPFAGPRRARPPGLALTALPPIDAVLLSHNHYDHMDLPALRRLDARHGGGLPIITGLGNAAPLRKAGLRGAVELDWWEGVALGPQLRATFVPAQHWSSRGPTDRRRTLWGGFWIAAGPLTVYFAGDSGYSAWFATLRARMGPPDLALLPIGAYAPRWFMAAQHMDPADAVRAHGDLGARHSLGMHFGTIKLTDEGIDAPLAGLAAAREAAGLPPEAFTTLDIGQSRVFRA